MSSPPYEINIIEGWQNTIIAHIENCKVFYFNETVDCLSDMGPTE